MRTKKISKMGLLNTIQNVMIYVLIVGYILIVIYLGKGNGDNLIHLVTGNYPMDGDYWVSFSSENGTVFADIMYQQNIYENEPVNMSNLELFIDGNESYKITKDEIYSDEKLRIYLLENGFAHIVNEEKATKNEISAQKRAAERRYGSWIYGTNSKSGMHVWVGKCLEFIQTNIWKIILILFPSLFGLDKIKAVLEKKFRKKKIDVIFFGSKGAGKTSIITRLRNPSMTEGEFIARTDHTTSARDYKELLKNRYGKYDIYTYTCDDRGDNYSGMQDSVLFSDAEIIVIVYVIDLKRAANQAGADTREVEKQMVKALTVCDSLINCSAFENRVDKIIVFVNKCDLLAEEDAEAAFEGKKEWGRGIKSAKEQGYCKGEIDYSFDSILYGSALKNWGIWKLQEEIKSSYEI